MDTDIILADPILGKVDVYPVGFYSDARRFWHRLRRGEERAWRHFWYWLRRSWHRRSYWNGYLAEPYHCPPGLTKVGRGFTRKAARRSLARRIVATR